MPTRSWSSPATAPTTRRSTAPPASCRSGSCPAAARASSRARSGCRETRSPPRAQIVDALVAGRSRSIALGRVNGRRFCFSAGIGLDAEAVRRVDALRARPRGPAGGQRDLRRRRREAGRREQLRLTPQLEVVGYGRAAFVLVANGRPYTYAGPVPVAVAGRPTSPRGSTSSRRAQIGPGTVPSARHAAVPRHARRRPRTCSRGTTSTRSRVRCDRPLPLQADGEDLGDVTRGRVRGGAGRPRRAGVAAPARRTGGDGARGTLTRDGRLVQDRRDRRRRRRARDPRGGNRRRAGSSRRSRRRWPVRRSASPCSAGTTRSAASSAGSPARSVAVPIVAGALRRGGTRLGLAVLVGLAALLAAAFAFVPFVGYLEAVALPAFGLRTPPPRARAARRASHART